MKRITLVAICFLFSSSAFSEDVVFDGSSPESIVESFQNIASPLSEEDQRRFLVALIRIQLSDFPSPEDVPDELHGKINLEYLATKIDGLSFQEILILADKSQTKAEFLK